MPKRTIGMYMTANPVAIESRSTLAEAHDRMRASGIRHLPVVDDGQLVGVVSQRDLYLLQTLRTVDPAAETVGEAMMRSPYTVAPETPLEEVARRMSENKYGSAVVVERGAVVGMFTTVDALRALAAVLRRRVRRRPVKRPGGERG